MDALRLVVDGRALVGAVTGIGVHTAEIAKRVSLGCPPVVASHAPISIELEGQLESHVHESRPGVWWQQRHLPRISRELEADVVWGPHGTLPLMLSTPAVVTVHDLTSLDMPQRHRLKTILSFNTLIGPSLEKARKIVAVSRHTADQVIRRFGIGAAKIEVVHNGVSDFFSPPQPGEESSEEIPVGDFILCVGTIEPRKGLDALLEAWSGLPWPRPRLVLCGSVGWGSDQLLERLATEKEIVRTGWVSRPTLRALYRAALVTVYPSVFEGFGLPVIEAMKCGSPVVTTRGGAIPEVAGDAALLVAPGDAEALRDAIGSILRSKELREELRELGLTRAGEFSWDAAARSFERIFWDAVEGEG